MKFCTKCGKEINDEAVICPNCGCATGNNEKPEVKAKKPVYKKWWFWLLIALAVIVVIAIGSGSGSSETSSQAGTDSIVSEAGKADNVYMPGDTFEANGLKITYVKAEKWTSDNMFLQPEDGNMYIRLFISAENTASGDRYITYFDFDCYSDGIASSSTYIGDDMLNGGSISQGRKAEGWVYFEVPTAAKDIEVEYETSFWTGKKAILKVTGIQ